MERFLEYSGIPSTISCVLCAGSILTDGITGTCGKAGGGISSEK